MQLQKTSAWRKLFIFKAPLLCANRFFLINHTRKLFWHSNLNEPQRKNFVLIIIQLSEVGIQPSSKLFELLIQMSGLFIHVANLKIIISNLNPKFCIYFLQSWHFLNNVGKKFNYMRFLPIQFGNEELKSRSSIWCIVLHDLS